MIYRKVFCTLKHHKPAFEKKYDFLGLFCLLIIEFYFKKGNFEDNFSGKVEVSGWMKTNMTAASYHPLILSPKHGQTGNVKPLSANRSLSEKNVSSESSDKISQVLANVKSSDFKSGFPFC